MSEAALRVGIVDDHEVVRNGVRLMAETIEGIEVVAEASNGNEALELCEAYSPDVLLMDVDMPELGGVETTRRVREAWPHMRVLMLTVHEDDDTVFEAVRAGASGYLTKSSTLDEVQAAFTAIRQGGAYMTPVAARKALKCLARKADAAEQAAKAVEMTTEREREILELLAKGLSAREVARQLGISERTVNTHVGHIYRRLGVTNRVEAVRAGMRLGLVKTP